MAKEKVIRKSKKNRSDVQNKIVFMLAYVDTVLM